MTEKLFYQDSHRSTFTAIVQEVRPSGNGYEIILDRTAFFPEGGGQSSDTGSLGGVSVSDVQEIDGKIIHYTDGPLVEGTEVEGCIDWTERFSKMQQHTGEHIVSGLIHKIYGYHNVGFHLGTDSVTLDFNGVVPKEKLHEIEQLANEAVAKNLPVQVLYPTDEELSKISYRSKIEIEGQVRIVVIDGYDVCACCAPHVKQTGEIGLIKLVGMQNYKGGVRISMLCGFRALEDYYQKEKNNREIAVMLSAKEYETAVEVERLQEELAMKKAKIAELEQKFLEQKVETLDVSGEIVCLFEETDPVMTRELVNLLLKKGAKMAAVFSGNEREGYRYVLGSRSLDVRKNGKLLNEAFHGRGGGKLEMVQGTVQGKREEIEAFLNCR
ncbi:MAG: alanyl-tRNA editing protein [Faecalimonas umbilicata]|uniref:alanyl-tRNA editing protein n=1 Tax=Faecalimonas umbilicata TaxID=1912855 RepID=UPI002A76072F|nr:alanyl-tRNA editing protein [Faecalimonas umbilicata]MDY2761799.1 alanyl-tRNA editing protein [Faecalimonas umbilicata]